MTVGTLIIGIFITEKTDLQDYSNLEKSSTDQTLGVLFVVISQVAIGFKYVGEQYILDSLSIDSSLLISVEGCIGTIIFLILLPILYLVELEDIMIAFSQMREKPILIVESFCIVILFGGFSLTSLMIS